MVSGGCISQTGKIFTSAGPFFAKWGDSEVAQTYAPEVRGLNRLRAACEIIRIPEVIEQFTLESGAGLLLMEWIDVRSPTHACWAALGQGLAEMHARTSDAKQYGFPEDNFIGGSAQINGWRDHWPQFFSECRLQPQWEAAERAGILIAGWEPMFSKFLARIHQVLPSKPQNSLIHGDLWSGNVFADRTGRPVLIDPAVYYGHGEVDLAMSRLFGSFPDAFYRAYYESETFDSGTQGAGNQLIAVYNLYHLLNHLNLFGTGYQSSVESTLRSIDQS